MVTLVETKSESRTRRAGRLRGGVCGSAEKSVPQPVDFFAACEDFLGGFHQYFRCCRACGHEAGDDFTPPFGQHIAVGFGDFFD